MILDFINFPFRELKESTLTFWLSSLSSFPANIGSGPYVIAYTTDGGNSVRIENCSVEYSTDSYTTSLDSYTTSNNISITLSDNSLVWTI